MYELLLDEIWKLQRLFRRKLRLIRLKKISISTSKEPVGFYEIEFYCNENLKFDNYKKIINPVRRVLRIKDVCLNPKTGIAWYKKFIIEESSNWPIDKLLLWEPRPLLCQSLNYKVVNLPDNGFYHFLIEDLPRFLEIYEKNSSAVTVIGSESRYVLEVLDFLNITNYVSKFSPIKCRELLLSEKSLGGIFEKNDHKLLQRIFADIEPSKADKPIFISRRNKSKGYLDRGIQYSDLLEKKLSNCGFITVYLEDLSFIEQVSLIKSTNTVVGFHGAGLANIVWLNSNAKVIEISETRKTSHFEHISSVCKVQYGRFMASKLVNLNESEILDLISRV